MKQKVLIIVSNNEDGKLWFNQIRNQVKANCTTVFSRKYGQGNIPHKLKESQIIINWQHCNIICMQLYGLMMEKN